MVVAAGGAATAVARGMAGNKQRPKSGIFQASLEMQGNLSQNHGHLTLAGIQKAHLHEDDPEASINLRAKIKHHWLLDSKWFEALVALFAFLNAAQMGLATDVTYGKWPTVWTVTEHSFTTIFFVEMIVKLKILRLEYFKDRWNVFDFCLVVMSVLDNWLLAWLSNDPDSIIGRLTILRILRIARCARVFRMVRYFDQLVALIEALVYSIKTMGWAYLLLLLLVYVYSLVCVEFIGTNKDYPARSEELVDLRGSFETWNNYQFFGTVFRSMYSLFSVITLSEFSMITRPVFERQPVMVVFLISFTCFSAFGIMNVVVGLLVQQALEVSTTLMKAREEAHAKEQMERVFKIKRVLEALDDDGDNDITKDELRRGLSESEELMDLFVQIDLPPNITVDEVFTLIDYSGDGHVSPEEFASQLMRLIDCSQFQQLCLMQISMNHVKRILGGEKQLDEVGERRSWRNSLASAPVETKFDELGERRSLLDLQLNDMAQAGGTQALQDSITTAMEEIKDEISKTRDELLAKMDSLVSQKRPTDCRRDDLLLFRAADAKLLSAEKLEGHNWEQLPDCGLPVRLEGGNVQKSVKDELLTVPRQVAAKGSPSERPKPYFGAGCTCVERGSEREAIAETVLSGGNGLIADTVVSRSNGSFMGDKMPLTSPVQHRDT